MGSRVDLPGEIREKMEASFGADFSNVKLYESDTVAQAGAEAMTQGQNIAFAPGKLDLASTAGQALLGHELSHVVSQARGESAGHGFLADTGLEAQADRQGMLAAQGESVYEGPVSPIGTSSAVGAAGPMQAKKKSEIASDALKQEEENRKPEEGAVRRRNDAYYAYDLDRRARNEEEGITSRGISSMFGLGGKSYASYANYKLDQTQDKDEQLELMKLFMEGSQDDINAMMRDDALSLSSAMNNASYLMNRENFEDRATAYSNSGNQMGLLNALSNSDLSGALDEEEQAAFQNRINSFQTDRENTRNSMMAAIEGKEGKPFATGKQRALRKAYRKNRRKEIEDGHFASGVSF